jgi:hypothetical protein
MTDISMAGGHSIDHEVAVKATASSVRAAIVTSDGLRGWNTRQVSGDGTVGSEWTLSYEGAPDFRWRVDRSDASGVLWTCTQGPGDSIGTTVEYVLEDMPDGRTRVSLKHRGWPRREGNFQKCNTLWGAMFFQLKRFVESGKPMPLHG